MKPAPFKYEAPEALAQALELLSEYGDEAKALAGGQSLIPAMNFRLVQPAVLIDLNRVSELFYLRQEPSGELRIGAMTRQRALERDDAVRQQFPLIAETMPFIAHPQIRNRGTVGGSLAHADPAAELPAVMVALKAQFRLQSRDGERWLAADEFFSGFFETALQPGELLTEIRVPPMPQRCGCAFQEMARRHGDYALAGVAVVLESDENEICREARIVYLSVGGGPERGVTAENMLAGEALTRELIHDAAAETAARDLDPPGDIHASADFRRHLAKVLTIRAITTAAQRAGIVV